jgi:hypothetical protein
MFGPLSRRRYIGSVLAAVGLAGCGSMLQQSNGTITRTGTETQFSAENDILVVPTGGTVIISADTAGTTSTLTPKSPDSYEATATPTATPTPQTVPTPGGDTVSKGSVVSHASIKWHDTGRLVIENRAGIELRDS